LYLALGDKDSAMTTRRGVVPEYAEKSYLNARSTKRLQIKSKAASFCQHIITHPPEKRMLTTPKSNLVPTSRPEFRATATESRGSFVSVLNDGAFWFDGYNSVIVDRNEQVLREHIKGNPYVVAEAAKFGYDRKLSGTACFLDARSSSIYYHWMMDVLPKFLLLEAAGIRLQSIDYFVVRCASKFQLQTLEILGVPKERIVSTRPEAFTRCEKLIVPFLKHDRGDRFYNGMGLGMSRWVPQWLKSVFITTSGPAGRRLYLSRKAGTSRSVTDEPLLIQALLTRNFECVLLEELNVHEQANLLASASVVVLKFSVTMWSLVTGRWPNLQTLITTLTLLAPQGKRLHKILSQMKICPA